MRRSRPWPRSATPRVESVADAKGGRRRGARQGQATASRRLPRIRLLRLPGARRLPDRLAKGTEATIAVAIYAVSLSALFGVSALYHVHEWQRPSARRWMRRLDHTMIFFLIAGTLTPFAVLVMDRPLATALLIAVWGGALAGTIVELVWLDSPKWLSAIVYVAVGLIGAIGFPAIISEAGLTAGLLIAGGGALYATGAVVYAAQRPEP